MLEHTNKKLNLFFRGVVVYADVHVDRGPFIFILLYTVPAYAHF